MANADNPMGFRLITTGGHEPIRRKRQVDSANVPTIAPGDAYTIEADGNVTRATAATTPNGIVEGIVLKGKSEGPESYNYLPTLTAGEIIGIEDASAEFEVETSAVLAQLDFDVGALVNLVDAPANAVLGQSRQMVGGVGGTQFKLVQHVDRPDNDKTAANSQIIVKLVPANVQ